MATSFLSCSKLEAMAIYVVESTNANDIMQFSGCATQSMSRATLPECVY
jgi:hypothetical protein